MNDIETEKLASTNRHSKLAARVDANGLKFHVRNSFEQELLEPHVATRHVEDSVSASIIAFQLFDNALPSGPCGLARTTKRFAIIAIKRCVQTIENVDSIPMHDCIVAIDQYIWPYSKLYIAANIKSRYH